jgi:hypothetical protein
VGVKAVFDFNEAVVIITVLSRRPSRYGGAAEAATPAATLAPEKK